MALGERRYCHGLRRFVRVVNRLRNMLLLVSFPAHESLGFGYSGANPCLPPTTGMLQDSWSPVTVPSSILATLIISAAPLQAPHRHFSILGSRRSRFPHDRYASYR